MDNTTQTEDERKAALMKEATEVGARVDPNWTADQMAKVIARKKAAAPVAQAAAKPAEPQASAEGDDDSGADSRIADLETALSEATDMIVTLKADNDKLAAEVATARAAEAKLTDKLNAANATIFELEAAKGALEVQMFDAGAAKKGIVDKPQVTEDFGGKKEQPAAKPTASKGDGLVSCKVTKAGDGKIFTGEPGEFFKRDQVTMFPAATVAALEEKGWVEAD